MSVKPWTAAEDIKLLQMADNGENYEAIAKAMKRTTGSIRNRLSRIRNPEHKEIKVVIGMSPKQYGEFATAAERADDLAAELQRAKSFSDAIYDDYLKLYELCSEIIKAHKNHRNIKPLLEKLERETDERFPCPF